MTDPNVKAYGDHIKELERQSVRDPPHVVREALRAAKAAMIRTRTASIAGCEEGYGKPQLWADELFASHGDLTKAIALCADAEAAISAAVPSGEGTDQ